MSRVVFALLFAFAAAAQDSHTLMEQALAKQRASIEQQNGSIAKQRAALHIQAKPQDPSSSSFFTVPWTEPLIPPVVQPECDPVPEEQIGPLVKKAAARTGLTPDLLRAVIERESSYIPCAVSSQGAQGLMQLMPGTAAELGVQNPLDPQDNVDAGARYLKQMIDRYGGNVVLALAAYNAGPQRVDDAGGVPEIPETMGYVTGILGKLFQTQPDIAQY